MKSVGHYLQLCCNSRFQQNIEMLVNISGVMPGFGPQSTAENGAFQKSFLFQLELSAPCCLHGHGKLGRWRSFGKGNIWKTGSTYKC